MASPIPSAINKQDPLGFDLYIGPVAGGGSDMSPDGRSCSGVELARNEMFARCQADTLTMAGAPGGFVEFGVDCRSMIGATTSQSEANSLGQRLASAFARSPRLDPGSIVVNVEIQRAGEQYAFVIKASARTTTKRPVSMICGISSVSVDMSEAA